MLLPLHSLKGIQHYSLSKTIHKSFSPSASKTKQITQQTHQKKPNKPNKIQVFPTATLWHIFANQGLDSSMLFHSSLPLILSKGIHSVFHGSRLIGWLPKAMDTYWQCTYRQHWRHWVEYCWPHYFSGFSKLINKGSAKMLNRPTYVHQKYWKEVWRYLIPGYSQDKEAQKTENQNSIFFFPASAVRSWDIHIFLYSQQNNSNKIRYCSCMNHYPSIPLFLSHFSI